MQKFVSWHEILPEISQSDVLRRKKIRNWNQTWWNSEEYRSSVQKGFDVINEQMPSWVIQYDLVTRSPDDGSESLICGEIGLSSIKHIGRSSKADICLEDPMISSLHVRLIFQADFIIVEDLDSRNGTYVNRKKIEPHKQSILREKELLTIGSTQLIFIRRLSSFQWRTLVQFVDIDYEPLHQRCKRWLDDRVILVLSDQRIQFPIYIDLPSSFMIELMYRAFGISYAASKSSHCRFTRLEKILNVYILKAILKIIAPMLKNLSDVYIKEIHYLTEEDNSRFDETEPDIWITSIISTGNSSGEFNLGMREDSISTILGMTERQPGSKKTSYLLATIGSQKISISLIAGFISFDIADLNSLKPGDVVLFGNSSIGCDENGLLSGKLIGISENFPASKGLNLTILKNEGQVQVICCGTCDIGELEVDSMDSKTKKNELKPTDEIGLEQQKVLSEDEILVNCTVELCKLQMSLSEIAGLRNKDIIPLQLNPSDPVSLVCGKRCVGKGRLVLIGSQLSIEMIEIAGNVKE